MRVLGIQLWKNAYLLITFLILSSSLWGQHERRVSIDTIPKTTADFIELRNQLIDKPEGTCALFIVALKIFTFDKVTGNECLISLIDRTLLLKSAEKYTYQGYKLPTQTLALFTNKLKKYPYLPNSYFPGAVPENNYHIGEGPYEFVFYKRLYSGSEYSGKLKYFIPSNGASKQRPLSMVRTSKGNWLISEFEPILATVKRPIKEKSEEP